MILLAFYGSRVSPHMTETPEGFLICHDVPIARTGKQDYLEREIGGDRDDMIAVIRTEDEVFSRAAMASFEGKPVTEEHPPIQVTSENSGIYAKGHVQNVHRGSGDDADLLLADLFITDGELIRAIKNGLREVSCGYECEYVQDERGKVYQRQIRGNHVAVVAAGRAGGRVSIQDSKPTKRGVTHMSKNSKPSIIGKLFARWAQDAEPEEVAEAIDAMIEGEEEPKTTDAENTGSIPAQTKPEEQTPITVTEQDAAVGANAEVISLLKQVIAKLGGGAGDADPELDPLKQLQQDLAGDPSNQAVPQLLDGMEQEASQTIPAEELNGDSCAKDGEEEGEEEKPFPFESKDSAGTMAAINAMKPYLAKLPAKDRKMAADSIAKAVRQARGMDAVPAVDNYAALLRAQAGSAKRRTGDAASNKESDYGAACAKRNPHTANK